MSKFGLLDPEDGSFVNTTPSLSERVASFPATRKRHEIDIAAFDAAVAPLGFVSREVSPETALVAGRRGPRRRAVPSEPTRHLAIRLTVKQYDRFVRFADRHRLTYHEALLKLLDQTADDASRAAT